VTLAALVVPVRTVADQGIAQSNETVRIEIWHLSGIVLIGISHSESKLIQLEPLYARNSPQCLDLKNALENHVLEA
jgi:hypothetical protein